MSNDQVRVGAIGAGWWATTNHFPLLAQNPDVALVGVSSIGVAHLEHVKDVFGFERATEDFRELLSWDLDAVVVASPHYLHYLHAAAGLDHGLAVLCEKPMTLSAVEAWDLVDRASRSDAALLVSLGWNYKPFLQQAFALMRDIGVGTIQFVSVRMASPTKGLFTDAAPAVPVNFTAKLTGPDPQTWQDPRRGGGYTHGQLSHAAGLLFWLTGLRASQVVASSSAPGSDVDLYDCALIDFVGGAHGVLSGAGTLPDGDKFQLGMEIFGSEGVLIIDVERERVELRRHDKRNVSLEIPVGQGDYSCEGPVDRLIQLAKDRTVENNSNGSVGARSVELLSALQESAENIDHPRVSIDQSLGSV